MSSKHKISIISKSTYKPAMAPITGDKIKKEMISSFSKLKLDCYGDILRIKKPQQTAFVAS